MTRTITARSIQIALAILWLIDGLFQLQPQMFTKHFALDVIAPASVGQPFFVSSVVNFFVHVTSMHAVIFGILFALIQLAIGILILVKPTIKIGLISSIIWGLIVWYVGEGAGGIFGGQTSLLIGAPGAALLYSLLSLGVFPKKQKTDSPTAQPAPWLAIVWAVTWVGGAIYQLLPGQNSVSDIGSMVVGNGDGTPAWLRFLDTHIGNFILSLTASHTSMTGGSMAGMQMTDVHTQSNSGIWFVLFLALIQCGIGLLIFLPSKIRKVAITSGILLSVIFWVLGQNLGEYYSGLATDPSTAPLIILLGFALLSNVNVDTMLKKIYKKIKPLPQTDAKPSVVA